MLTIRPAQLFAALSAVAAASSSATTQSRLPMAGIVDLDLTMCGGSLHARVLGPEPGYFGVVLISVSPRQAHFLSGLPPILRDFEVYGAGFADDRELVVQARPLPAADLSDVRGQAVLLGKRRLWASCVECVCL